LLPTNLPHSPRQVTGYRTCRSHFFQKKATIGSERPNLSAEEQLIVVVCFVCFAALLSRTVASSSFDLQNRLKCFLVQQHSSRPQILCQYTFLQAFPGSSSRGASGAEPEGLRERGSRAGKRAEKSVWTIYLCGVSMAGTNLPRRIIKVCSLSSVVLRLSLVVSSVNMATETSVLVFCVLFSFLSFRGMMTCSEVLT